MKAAVCIDSWKKPIFERILKEDDWEWEEKPGVAPGTVTLSVTYQGHPWELEKSVRRANEEAATMKGAV